MKIKKLLNKKIAILGFGLEGKSTLNFLLEAGISNENITILDSSPISPFPYERKIKVISGEKYLDNLGDFDLIIKSNGISPYNPKIEPFLDKLTSHSQIFFDNYEGKIIGVTQTKGKSTTSSLIFELLQNAGYKVKLVGNIGKPVLDEVNIFKQKEKLDFIVYELSSYMLENFQPKLFIGVLGNIFPDHLDWHKSLENYQNAKLNILKNSENIFIGEKVLDNFGSILNNFKEKNIYTFGKDLKNNYSFLGENFYINGKKLEQKIETNLLGEHNLLNLSGVLGISDFLKIPEKIFFKTIKNFNPLEHRLEKFSTKNGIIFVDDAISTTPESTIEAINTFGENIGTIFLGGLDRGYNFDNLVKTLEKYKIKNLVLFPETGSKILSIIDSKEYNICETSSMKVGVDFAFKYTRKGQVCLLSTASPSYNLWKNFEAKGNEFKKFVQEK